MTVLLCLNYLTIYIVTYIYLWTMISIFKIVLFAVHIAVAIEGVVKVFMFLHGIYAFIHILFLNILVGSN